MGQTFFSDLVRERIPSDAAEFEHQRLNHVETTEKQTLPNQQGTPYCYAKLEICFVNAMKGRHQTYHNFVFINQQNTLVVDFYFTLTQIFNSNSASKNCVKKLAL